MMIHRGTAKMWNTVIGYFFLDERRGTVLFEYDQDFIESGIELSPIKMPLSSVVYEFPELVNTSFKGVPGLLSDSLPDRYGNAVINAWLASQGRDSESFNVIERLCYTGKRGMGALEYEPDSSEKNHQDQKVDISKMAEFASKILNNKNQMNLNAETEISYQQLLKLGTSAGGARAKAIIAYNEKTGEVRSGQIDLDQDFAHWLIKFDGVKYNGDHQNDDEPEYTLIEYSYYLMAKKAGITMSECRLLPDGKKNHFMTKRFDRDKGKKMHMQSLGALLHIDYNVPGLCSYEQAALTARKMKCSNRDIEQLFRRMVFNVLAVNQDDHVKNISFLMDREGQWSLSPAYDITFAYNLSNVWLRSHQMTINEKTRDLTKIDLIAAGKAMDLTTAKCKTIIQEVYEVVKEYETYAKEVHIKKETINEITKKIGERIAQCLN